MHGKSDSLEEGMRFWDVEYGNESGLLKLVKGC